MCFDIGMTPPGRDGRISFRVGWQPTPANGATYAFGRRPLSHAPRPFIGSNPKVAFGSDLARWPSPPGMSALCALRPFTAASPNRMTPPHRDRSEPEYSDFNSGPPAAHAEVVWRPQPVSGFVPIYTIGASGSEPALAAIEAAHLPTENRARLSDRIGRWQWWRHYISSSNLCICR